MSCQKGSLRALLSPLHWTRGATLTMANCFFEAFCHQFVASQVEITLTVMITMQQTRQIGTVILCVSLQGHSQRGSL